MLSRIKLSRGHFGAALKSSVRAVGFEKMSKPTFLLGVITDTILADQSHVEFIMGQRHPFDLNDGGLHSFLQPFGLKSEILQSNGFSTYQCCSQDHLNRDQVIMNQDQSVSRPRTRPRL